MNITTRPAQFNGSFYPESPKELINEINQFLGSAKIFPKKCKTNALIVPHAGYIYSGSVAGAGYKNASHAHADVSDIILIGPSHRTLFNGIAVADFESWETPIGKVKLSKKISQCVQSKAFQISKEIHLFEHSLEVQIPFIQTVFKNASILPLLTGSIDSYDISIEIEKLLDEKTIVIVSTDLSHYLPYEDAKKIDKKTIQKILNKNEINHEEACGADGVNLILQISKRKDWKPNLIEYKNSGDTAGNKDQVVGYCSILFY